MEKKLTSNPVGIRLFGTFIVTRHAVHSVFNFIFATEIVLLQMASAFRLEMKH